jgi:hypothetical protein
MAYQGRPPYGGGNQGYNGYAQPGAAPTGWSPAQSAPYEGTAPRPMGGPGGFGGAPPRPNVFVPRPPAPAPAPQPFMGDTRGAGQPGGHGSSASIPDFSGFDLTAAANSQVGSGGSPSFRVLPSWPCLLTPRRGD